MRLVYVATHPYTAFRLMHGQLAYMQRRGFDVATVTAPGPLLDRTAEREGVRTYEIPMERSPAPGKDLVSLARLAALFRRLQPAIIYAGTPKAGLLGVLAGRAARVPTVVYHLRGLRFSTATGVTRLALVTGEHVAARLADWVFCNSESSRREFVARGFVPMARTWIPAHGSSNGVDVERFEPRPEVRAWANDERRRLGIADGALVVGFVGRFTRDKGLAELEQALAQVRARGLSCHLLAVGDFDDTDPLPADLVARMKSGAGVTVTGYVEEPARHYAMMDLLAFPSYREGFPNAPLEAAAAGLPTVGFRAVGTVDAVVDGETGTLVPIGDVEGLAGALERYARDAGLRARHGAAARGRVRTLFRREVVWEALAAKFEELAANGARKGRPR
ncbi:MAG: glycosyltransferase family 4 protein [Myxococcales bacterium]|nr:glycosyltransferase family 4 protein [Myxococcales bacterium]